MHDPGDDDYYWWLMSDSAFPRSEVLRLYAADIADTILRLGAGRMGSLKRLELLGLTTLLHLLLKNEAPCHGNGFSSCTVTILSIWLRLDIRHTTLLLLFFVHSCCFTATIMTCTNPLFVRGREVVSIFSLPSVQLPPREDDGPPFKVCFIYIMIMILSLENPAYGYNERVNLVNFIFTIYTTTSEDNPGSKIL